MTTWNAVSMKSRPPPNAGRRTLVGGRTQAPEGFCALSAPRRLERQSGHSPVGRRGPDRQPADLLREPYIFEFLKIPEPYQISETQLETLLCDHLQSFLLELGKGFTFVGRQYRVTLNNTHYRVDLVFYHRILRCFVLIDLKLAEVRHDDIGQMNLYLGYFANDENVEGDHPPIGIILSRNKEELLVEYATYGMNSQLFVQKYQLYLPDREALKAEIERTLAEVGR